MRKQGFVYLMVLLLLTGCSSHQAPSQDIDKETDTEIITH